MVTLKMVYFVTFSLEISAYHLHHHKPPPLPNNDEIMFDGSFPPPRPPYNPFIEGILKPLDNIAGLFDGHYYNLPPKTNLGNFNNYGSEYSYDDNGGYSFSDSETYQASHEGNVFHKNLEYNRETQNPVYPETYSNNSDATTNNFDQENKPKHESESKELTSEKSSRTGSALNYWFTEEHTTRKNSENTSEIIVSVTKDPLGSEPKEPFLSDKSVNLVKASAKENTPFENVSEETPDISTSTLSVLPSVQNLSKSLINSNEGPSEIQTYPKVVDTPTKAAIESVKIAEFSLVQETPPRITITSSMDKPIVSKSEITDATSIQENNKDTSTTANTDVRGIVMEDAKLNTSVPNSIAIIPLSKPLASAPLEISPSAAGNTIHQSNPLERLVLNDPSLERQVQESLPILESVKNNPQEVLGNSNIEIPNAIKAIPVYGIFALLK